MFRGLKLTASMCCILLFMDIMIFFYSLKVKKNYLFGQEENLENNYGTFDD